MAPVYVAGPLLDLALRGLAVSESCSRLIRARGGMKLLPRACRLKIRVIYRILYGYCEAISRYVNP